jgi:hypothetical protein
MLHSKFVTAFLLFLAAGAALAQSYWLCGGLVLLLVVRRGLRAFQGLSAT